MTENLLNKFNDVESLAEAYKNLEKEFTKRSIMVSNLQKQVDELTKELQLAKSIGGKDIVPNEISAEEKENIIRDFLREISRSKSQAVISGVGEAVKAPPKKPKNLKEANLMAKYFLLGE